MVELPLDQGEPFDDEPHMHGGRLASATDSNQSAISDKPLAAMLERRLGDNLPGRVGHARLVSL